MRTFEDMEREFHLLGRFLEKYVQISKLPADFGIGEPLYPSEIHCLAALCGQSPLGVTELAGVSGVTKGAVSQLISRLEDKGLATRTPDPANRSRTIIEPTGKGRKAQEGHMRFHQEHDKRFLSRLGSLNDEEYETFSRICRWLDQWMDSYLR